MFRRLFLIITLTGYTPVGSYAAGPGPAQGQSMPDLLNQSYSELFRRAPELALSPQQLERYEEQLEKEKEGEENRLEGREDSIENQIDRAQKALKNLKQRSQTAEIEERRHALHCDIQALRKDLREVRLVLEEGLDLKYDNRFAKFKVLQEWPRRHREVQSLLERGKAPQEKFSDFRDVGFRGGVFEGQEEDIEDGQEAIEQMKRRSILPPEVEDAEVVEYVRSLAERIGRNSDLQVPLTVTVLRSEEINAFALPGGFLFINSGLIQKARTESELAGVIAHEIAHVTARHGDRLSGKANIANIIFQSAQLAALILSGGAASIATYYALQYGFFGLGLVLDLSLLGVSRDYEIEADILGTQYLWHAGFNTEGFLRFFERMAQEEGYVTGLSWFRTHPPFYDRMQTTFEQILYLPQQEQALEDSQRFRDIKQRIGRVLEEMKERDRDAPTLRRVYDCEKSQDL